MADTRDRHRPDRPDGIRLGWLLAALASWNVVSNTVIPSAAYVPAGLAATAALLAVARRWGHTEAELGTEPTRARSGAVWGLAAALVVVVGLAALAAWPWSRRFFADATVTDVTIAGLLYQVALRIPVGTALLEEVAFRGVLFAQWRRIAPTRVAVVGTSVVFGLWHILPTLGRLRLNPAGGYAVNGIAGSGIVLAAVVTTGLAGAAFALLRLRSGSLVSPLVAHAVINGVAFTLGWIVAA